MLLDLARLPYELIEVPYGNREALARLTGGYIYVPVLELEDGTALTESRKICEHLLARPEAADLVPSGLEAATWAYSDFVDGPLEDALFRIASPAIREGWPTAWERALYTLIKERRYGAGCVDQWQQDVEVLYARSRELLAPTFTTLERQPFVLGDHITFADVALYGQWAMLAAADPELLARLSPLAVRHAAQVEAAAFE